MGRLKYTSGSIGKVLELDGPITYVGIAGGFRRSQWTYDLEGRSISSPRRQAREEELEVITTIDIADTISAIADPDMALKKPGTFEGDGWTQRGFITGYELTDIRRPRCKLTLKVILLDGAWHKEELISMRQASGDANGTKIYPYEYSYYYASEYGVRYLEINDATPIPFRFVFYGPATNPTVRIGSNYYQFNISVPDGGYLAVASLPDSTVELVESDGSRLNAFSSAVRGDGEGCGNYAFEKILPGVNEVWWSDMFGFDLVLVHERSDFPVCN